MRKLITTSVFMAFFLSLFFVSVFAVTITTLSDGSNQKTLVYNSAGNKTVYVKIPKNTIVINAILELDGRKIDLFLDPGFEEDLSMWLIHKPSYTGICYRDNTSPHSGFYSAQCSAGDYTLSQYEETITCPDAANYNCLPVTPNTEYTFKFWYKGDSCYYNGFTFVGSGLSGDGQGLYGTFTGDLIFKNYWQEKTLTFRTSSGTSYVRLSYTIGHYYGCSGSMDGGWTDDISLSSNLSIINSPALDVGNDGDIEWSYGGEFNTVETVPNFSAEVNEYLSICTPDVNGDCLIPLVFYSDSAGAIKISNINVEYTITDECSVDIDCDDTDPCTIDTCSGSPKICSHTSITSCVNDDSCCPNGCTYANDTDCPTTCGDENCSADENKCTCPTDCGDCSGSCGTCREYKCVNSNCTCSIITNCCENGLCESNETYSNCCMDCPCPSGQTCQNNVCVAEEVPIPTPPSVGGGGGGVVIVVILTCKAQEGTICSINETCSEKWITASDTDRCCSKLCVPIIFNKTEIEKKVEELNQTKEQTPQAAETSTVLPALELVKANITNPEHINKIEQTEIETLEVTKSLASFENHTKTRGLDYYVKWIFGFVAEQEERDAQFLEGKSEELLNISNSLKSVADALEDIYAKNIILGEVEKLKVQADELGQEAKQKRENALGLISWIRNLL